jgi:hypothetical protein
MATFRLTAAGVSASARAATEKLPALALRTKDSTTPDEIGRERQRVSEQLARLDAERAKLVNELNELEIAERVLTRFGKIPGTIERRRRGRPARTAPVAPEAPRARRRRQAPTVALRDAVLRAVEAHRGGATANDVLTYLSREFGMTNRPNHLGMALQRHRRAGRLEFRDQRWYLPRT